MIRPRRLGAVLLAAYAALLLTSCVGTAVAEVGDTPPPIAESSTPTPQPSQPGADPTVVVAVDPALFAARELGSGVVFVSPSGDMHCGITIVDDGPLWGCRVDEKDWEFPSDDPADYCYDAQVPCGWGAEALGTGETHPRKRGDVAFESEIRADTPVLEYGSSITLADVTCISEKRGITCGHATSGHGFTLSSSINELW
jgi:hypothetical protein